MAIKTTVNIFLDSQTETHVLLTCLSDGSGAESGVKKVDITTLLNYNGVQPAGLRIQRLYFCMNAFTTIVLAWDRTAAANQAVVLSGPGGWLKFDDAPPEFMQNAGLIDPSEGNADNKGSILLTSAGDANGAGYTILLVLKKSLP